MLSELSVSLLYIYDHATVKLLRECWGVTEYIYYSLCILIADFSVLRKVAGINLNILNEKEQEFEWELEAILSHLYQKVSL